MATPWCILLSDGSARDQSIIAHTVSSGSEKPYVILTSPNPAIQALTETFEAGSLPQAKQKILDLNPGFVTSFSPRHLEAGVIDMLQSCGVRTYGISKSISLLENDKSLGKKFLIESGTKTPKNFLFKDLNRLNKWLLKNWDRSQYGYVLKNVTFVAIPAYRVMLPECKEEAIKMACDMSKLKKKCDILVEEKLPPGNELSLHVYIQNFEYILFPAVQDYKKAHDNDNGFLTSGMGAIATSLLWKNDIRKKIDTEVMLPIINQLKKQNINYNGIMYLGIYITKENLYVLEINTRPGNPEWIALSPLMERPILEIAQLASLNKPVLDKISFDSNKSFVVAVSALAPGAPEFIYENYDQKITGIELTEKTQILCDHIIHKKNHLYINGGRTIIAYAKSKQREHAVDEAYQQIQKISYQGIFYRHDIGTFNFEKFNENIQSSDHQ